VRVVVAAPSGRDGVLICNLLVSRGIACVNCSTAELARIEVTKGAAAVILAEEALDLHDISQWTAQIAGQPSWSDFPIIILTDRGVVNSESRKRMLIRQPLGNLILLERPVRPETLMSTVQAALRSRLRQYQMRDYLAERAKAEEALRTAEKLAVAGRLAASVAHEINNPLESVVNSLYLISLSSSLQESKEYAQTGMNELARVSEIVTQTLRFYRQNSKPVVVKVNEIMDSALVLYRARLSSAQIVLEKDFRQCPPIFARAGELRQLIVNLLGNAVDAMSRGGTLKIRITNSREHRNGARAGIRFTIADTGSGIPPEIRKRLFEPFVSTKGDLGTGLGLWVSSGIVQKHGGAIRVRSNSLPPATGTVFSVFLPLQPQVVSDGLSPQPHDEGREAGTELRRIPKPGRVLPHQPDDGPPAGFLASDDARGITGKALTESVLRRAD
jgi:signal transduction histidine kinase